MAAKTKGKPQRNKSVKTKATTSVKPPVIHPQSKPIVRPNHISRTQLAEMAFANQYVVDRNGTRALKECGYYRPKNDRVACVMAVELLARPSVQAYLKAAQAKHQAHLEKKYEVSADHVIRELSYCGFSNMNDYITVTKDGSAYVDLSLLRDPEIGPMLGAAIQKVESEHYIDREEVDKDGTHRTVKKVKIQLHEKRQALLELGKITGDKRFLRDDAGNSNPQLVAQQMMVVFNTMERKLLS